MPYVLSVIFEYFCLLQISEYSKENVCFVMFVDEQTLSKLSSEGNTPDDSGYVGLWKIVIMRNLPYKDMRKTGKVPKFLSHRLFPSSRYSTPCPSHLLLVLPVINREVFLMFSGFLKVLDLAWQQDATSDWSNADYWVLFVANKIRICYFKPLWSPLCLGGGTPK